MALLQALLEGFLAGVFTGAVLVWFYNRWLSGLRESWIKKGLSLATLPLAVLAGIGHAAAVYTEAPRLLLPVAGGAVVMLLRVVGWWRARRLNRATERHRLTRRGGGINWPHYPPPVRWALRSLQPLNQVDELELARREVPIRGLHPDLDGLRLLFLTDFHVHPTLAESWFRTVNRHALERRPDLLLVGGDFVSRAWHLPLARRLLAPLWKHPNVYAVRGNHDFWTRPSHMARELRRHGALLLSNRHVVYARGDGRLALIGLEAPYIPLSRRGRRRLEEELPGPSIPRIALVHTPEVYPIARRLGCQLALGGHTHGGQIRLPFFGTTVASVAMIEQHVHGIGRMGAMTTWTSNGLGAFYPVRIGCPPQLVEVILRCHCDGVGRRSGRPAPGPAPG